MTSHDLRCPQCGAHAVADADWCTLCYADLRPPAEPEPAGDAEVAAGSVPAAPVAAVAAPPRGKHARRTPTAGSVTSAGGHEAEPAAGVDVDVMLAQLAAETTPPLGDFMGRFDTKASRALVIAGGVAAVGLVLLLAMTILGSLL
jgi:hypothetical protein